MGIEYSYQFVGASTTWKRLTSATIGAYIGNHTLELWCMNHTSDVGMVHLWLALQCMTTSEWSYIGADYSDVWTIPPMYEEYIHTLELRCSNIHSNEYVRLYAPLLLSLFLVDYCSTLWARFLNSWKFSVLPSAQFSRTFLGRKSGGGETNSIYMNSYRGSYMHIPASKWPLIWPILCKIMIKCWKPTCFQKFS